MTVNWTRVRPTLWHSLVVNATWRSHARWDTTGSCKKQLQRARYTLIVWRLMIHVQTEHRYYCTQSRQFIKHDCHGVLYNITCKYTNDYGACDTIQLDHFTYGTLASSHPGASGRAQQEGG